MSPFSCGEVECMYSFVFTFITQCVIMLGEIHNRFLESILRNSVSCPLLTPWNRVVLKKPIVSHLVKKFPM